MADSPSRTRILFWRLGSALLLWSAVLLALFPPFPPPAGRVVALALFLGIGAAGFLEFSRLYQARGAGVLISLIAGAALLIWESLQLPGAGEAVLLAPVLLLVGLLLLKLLASGRIALSRLAVVYIGWFYVFWMLLFMVRIHAMGAWWLLHFIAVVKMSDTGAYLAGSLLGRHRMSPRISSGKTWEGFCGAVLFSTAASAALAYSLGDRLEALKGIPCVLLGGLFGGLAVAGDLVESLFKRENQSKDSGRIFPGIGGCLDLVDSLLFCAPFYYLCCRLLQEPSTMPA